MKRKREPKIPLTAEEEQKKKEKDEKLKASIDKAREDQIRRLHFSNLEVANLVGQMLTHMVEFSQDYGDSRAGRKIMDWATDMEAIYTALHRRKSTQKEMRVHEKKVFKERLKLEKAIKGEKEEPERVGPRIG